MKNISSHLLLHDLSDLVKAFSHRLGNVEDDEQCTQDGVYGEEVHEAAETEKILQRAEQVKDKERIDPRQHHAK